jgi:hypothetical protein
VQSSAPPQQTPAPKPAAPPQAPVPLAPSGTLTFQPEADMPKYDSTLYVVAISANQSIDPRSAIANAGSQYTTLTTRIAGVVRASLDPGAEDGIIVTLLPDGGSPDRTLGADSPVAVWNWRVAFKPTLMQSQVMLYLSVGSVDASGKLVPFGEAYQVKVNLKSSASGMADMAEASLLPTIWDSFNKWVGGAVTLLLGALGTWIVGRIKRKPASRPASAAS